MNPAFPRRRQAEQLDALLEGTSSSSPSAELAELLALAEQLRAVPAVAPRPEFAAGLRERLMAEAPSALAVAAPDAPDASADRLTVGHRARSTTSRERRISVAIAAFSIVGATTASAVASQSALPGDTLYPVKRLIEDARTSLAMGDEAKADVLLAQARTRLDEAGELGARDDIDTAAVTEALRDFGSTADRASSIVLAEYADHGDQADITELRTFAQQSVTTLSALTDTLPPSLDPVLADVTRTILAIDHSAAQACPACDAAGITELPSTLVDLLSASTAAVVATPSTVVVPRATKTPRSHAPSAAASPSPSSGPAGGSLTGTLTGATGGLTGGTTSPAKPSSSPTSVGGVVGQVGGTVGGIVGDTGGTVGGTVGGLGDQVGGTVGGTLNDVGGTVGDTTGQVGGTVTDVTGQVGGTLDSTVGGLLGGTSPTP